MALRRVYLLGALGGSAAVYAFGQVNTAEVGASGAIFGLFAAGLVLVRKLGLDPQWLVGIIVLNFVFTFSIHNISKLGHIGGFVAGGLAALAIAGLPQTRAAVQPADPVGRSRRRRACWSLVTVVRRAPRRSELARALGPRVEGADQVGRGLGIRPERASAEHHELSPASISSVTLRRPSRCASSARTASTSGQASRAAGHRGADAQAVRR